MTPCMTPRLGKNTNKSKKAHKCPSNTNKGREHQTFTAAAEPKRMPVLIVKGEQRKAKYAPPLPSLPIDDFQQKMQTFHGSILGSTERFKTADVSTRGAVPGLQGLTPNHFLRNLKLGKIPTAQVDKKLASTKV